MRPVLNFGSAVLALLLTVSAGRAQTGGREPYPEEFGGREEVACGLPAGEMCVPPVNACRPEMISPGQNAAPPKSQKGAKKEESAGQPARQAAPGRVDSAQDIAKRKLGHPSSQEELDAYGRIHVELDPETKQRLIEEFAATYPNSGLLAFVYQDGAYMARQCNNIELMTRYGEKALEIWPDNFVLMTELGSGYVQRNRIDQAEQKALRALELLENAPRPEYIPERQWGESREILLATNYDTLGYVHLRRAQSMRDRGGRRQEAEKAVIPFRKSLEFNAADDYALYGLGYTFALIDDYPNAESNLAKAAAVQGFVAGAARTLLDRVYRDRHNGSQEGLDDVIARAAKEIGIR